MVQLKILDNKIIRWLKQLLFNLLYNSIIFINNDNNCWPKISNIRIIFKIIMKMILFVIIFLLYNNKNIKRVIDIIIHNNKFIKILINISLKTFSIIRNYLMLY
jgi:hypothetical protein